MRSGVDVPPAELERARERVLADLRKRAAERLLFPRLERAFPERAPDPATLASHRAGASRLLAVVADRQGRATDLGDLPEALLGAKGLCTSASDFELFRARMRELLMPVAAIETAGRPSPLDDRGRVEDEYVRNWLLGTYGAWWAERYAASLASGPVARDARRRAAGAQVVVAFGPNPLGTVASLAAVTLEAPPDPSKSRLDDLLDDCREREAAAYRAAGQARVDAAKVDVVRASQRKLFEHTETLRSLQTELRQAKHESLVFSQKIFGLEERLRVSKRFESEGQTDHPFYLDKTQEPRARAILAELRVKLAAAKARVRAAEDRFTAVVSGSAEEIGNAAKAIEAAAATMSAPTLSAEELADRAFVACVDAHLDRKRAALEALEVDTTLKEQTTAYERRRAFAAVELLQRLRSAARRHVEAGGKEDAPPAEVRTWLEADGAAMNVSGASPAFVGKLWKEEVRKFAEFETAYASALTKLARYGIRRDAFEQNPPSLAELRIAPGETVSEGRLREEFRAASRFREGRFVGVAYPKSEWERNPLADIAFEQARTAVLSQWADAGRPRTMALHRGQLVRQVPKTCDADEKNCVFEAAVAVAFGADGDEATYRLEFRDAATELAIGQTALDKAQRVLGNVELFVDLRSSAQHWVDVFGHEPKAKEVITAKVAELNEAITLLERLDGLSFVHEGREMSGATLVAHLRAEREGGFRAELDETLKNIENDIFWRNVSGTLYVATLILTIATAGATSPLMAAVHTGFHAALVVNALTQTQSILNTLAYGSDRYWGTHLHDRHSNWSDVGKANLVSTALFFLGGTAASLVARAAAGAAEIALNARTAHVSLTEARSALTQVQAMQARGVAAEGTEAARVVMAVGRGGTLAESMAKLEGGLAWYRGGFLRVVHATGPLPSVGINYGFAVGGHTVVDLATAYSQGRKVDANFVYRAIGKHAAAEASTALFLGGGDRFIADRIGRFLTRAAARRPGLLWSVQMVGAGSVNVTISLTGKRIGDWLSDVEYARMFDKLLETDDRDPGVAARRDTELVELVDAVEKAKQMQHDAEAREWLHRLVVDVGIFGRRATSSSFRAQAPLRAAAAIRAGEPVEAVRRRMVAEMRPGLEERVENPALLFGGRREAEPNGSFHEIPGGAEVLVALLDAAGGTGPNAGNSKQVASGELDAIVRKLRSEGFVDVNRCEVERMIRRFAADAELGRRALLVGIESPDPSQPMRYAGALTTFATWVRVELRRDEAAAARRTRLATTPGTAHDQALKQERDAWFRLLALDARTANQMPTDLLVLPNRAEVRRRAIEALAYAHELDPGLVGRFLDVVAPVGSPTPKLLVLGDFVPELRRAAPIDALGPSAWMAERKVSVADYVRIFGTGESVRPVVLEAILRAERAGAKRVDERKFRAWFDANWGRFAGRTLGVDGWIALYRSMGAP
jgi:hypothetical protein